MAEDKRLSPANRSWHFRAPRYLLVPHLDVMDVLGWYFAIRYNLRELKGLNDEGRANCVRVRVGPNDDGKQDEIESFAKHLVGLRDAIEEADVSFAGVEEEFGTVANGIAEYHYQRQESTIPCLFIDVSWHKWVLHYMRSTLCDIRRQFGVCQPHKEQKSELTFWEADAHVHRTFTEQDVIDAVRQRESILGDLVSQIHEMDRSLWLTLIERLEQEMFRAWKRRFPNDQEPYEKLDPDSKKAQELVDRQETARRGGSCGILSRTQRAILQALEGRALTADDLEDATGLSRSTIYSKDDNGIGYLQERGLVANDRKVGGYYRPDAPPK